jgi:FkbM family methyltransferase
MSFISYAQNFEDVVLWRALKDVEKGFYIDVGANDPLHDSVTKSFYDLGWCGINIEPVTDHWNALVRERPRDINLCCAAGRVESQLELLETTTRGWSTGSPEVIAHFQSNQLEGVLRLVPVRSLSEICADYVHGDVHFLKIDVEGLELAVLEGANFDRYRPWIVVVESLLPHSTKENHFEWEHLLLSKNYDLAYVDGLNRFYLAREHSVLKSRMNFPPNVLDDFILAGQRFMEIRALQAEASAELAESRARETEIKAQEAESRAQLAEAKLQATEHRNRQELQENIRRIEILVLQAEERARQSEAIAREAEIKAQEAEAIAQHAEVKLQAAEELRGELSAIYNSRSWRLTYPLRCVWGKVRLIRAEGVSALYIAFLKKTFRKIDRELQKRPALRVHAVFWSKRIGILTLLRQLNAKAYGHRSPFSVRSALREKFERFFRNKYEKIFGYSGKDKKYQRKTYDNSVNEFDYFPYQKRTRILNPTLGVIYYYVDHTVLCPTNTGMQRVTRQLARALLNVNEKLIFVKWDKTLDRLVLVSTEDLMHLAKWGGPSLSEHAKAETGYLPEGSASQVIEGNDFSDSNWLVVPEVTHINYHQRQLTLDVILAAKRAYLRTAFVFYDAIPLRRTELAAMSSGHEAYMRQLLQADLILPISKWSGQDLQDFLMTHEGVAQDSLPTIQALLLPAQVPGQDRVQNQRTDISPPSKKQILCVGSIDERKNQIALAQAFNHLAEQGLTEDWQLIFIGNLNPVLSKEFHALITASRNSISWLGNCSDEELEKQYQDCTFTVFPSVEEGFGLPVAESLWLGKPCLCANFGPMAEIAEGGGCLTLNMHQRSAIEEGLQKLMHDSALRDKLIHEATTRILQDWLTYGRAFTAIMQAKVTPAAQLPVVYYLVDHTATFDNNTGIQRVVRCLAAGLLKQGVRLIPAKWNADKNNLIKISEIEREHLARWNGPSEDAWCDWSDLTHNQGAWLLMPELTPHYQNKDYTSIRQLLDLHGMQAGVIFYDTIPWKLQDIYSPAATQGHRTYMEGLNQFELILPISNYSREQLAFFYQGEQIDTSGLANRMRACPLPGEFLETARTLNVKPRHSNTVEVLSVGTLEPRKNHLTLVEAFLRAASSSSRPMRLTLAGGGPFPAIAERMQQLVQLHPTLLRWIVSPSDTVLNELYEACDFTVYPSYEEGFGLPILESLWHARPCICMDQGAMAEVAVDGGCLMVDTCDADALAQLLVQLSENDALRLNLAQQAIERPFRSWDDYAQDCAWLMMEAQGHKAVALNTQTKALLWHDLQAHMPNLQARPLLSVCISTYNRAKWLSLSLPVLIGEAKQWRNHIEIFVCDNTSTDTTPDVVAPYVTQGLVRYHRNPKNLGMLGNLRSTAQEAHGQYIWILGDDDIVKPGSVGRVVQALQQHPDLALVYLNYAYTRDESPKDIAQLTEFFAAATPVVPACPDQQASIKDLAVLNENFFTAIYCLVFQRAHAMQAYSQFTEGEPFSTLPTCVPTTHHVLHHMMDLKGYWLGEPQLVVNLNVSWMRYAWRWILERFPEMHDLAIKNGSDRRQVDRWRAHHLPGIVHFLTEIYGVNAADPVRVGFDMAYLISQIKHLNEYPAYQSKISKIYEDAFSAGHPLAKRNPDTIFINN